MVRRRKLDRSRSRNHSGGERCEWLGGKLLAPFFVEDGPEPYRPELAVWMEQPVGLVLGQEVIVPGDAEGAVARVLRTSMERPLAGAPRRPGTIRVADARLAAEVRSVVGDEIPIVVAPTPEFDALLQEMLKSIPEHDADASYLEGGRISTSPRWVSRARAFPSSGIWARAWGS